MKFHCWSESPGSLLGQMQVPCGLKALTSRSESVLEQRALSAQGHWLKQVCWTLLSHYFLFMSNHLEDIPLHRRALTERFN